MGDRQFEPFHALQKHAAARHRLQMHPAVEELAGCVVGEARAGCPRDRIGQQQARLQEHLKAVADAEDEPATVAELCQALSEPRLQFEREDSPTGDVVAVGESARDAEDLKVVGKRWLLCQRVHVHAAGDRAGPLESMRRFVVAVGARCPQDYCPW